MAELFGAIDCGTNSTRLLISDGKHQIVRKMEITRLGANVDETSMLDPMAIARTVNVLAQYREDLHEHGVKNLRITATSAARDASNRDEFFSRVQELFAKTPELLSGDEEAGLSFLGATAGLEQYDQQRAVVIDIGGGSTEFAVGWIGGGKPSKLEATLSLDVGCVRMTDRYIHSDPPEPDELSNCLGELEIHFQDVQRELPMLTGEELFIGLAGTVSTTAAVEIGLMDYDRDQIHHFELTKAAAEDVFRTLATESATDRKFNPGLEPERVDVIVGGLCVLVSVYRRFGYDTCLVSEADILDGLILSQIAN